MLRATITNLISMSLMALLLFGSAGTLAWPQGWAMFVLFNACTMATGLWLRASDPDLLRARSRSALSADQRPRDRLVMAAIVVFFAVWLVGMALDARRIGPSHVPVWGEISGGVLIVGAFLGSAQVLRANRFAATEIRLQPERGQAVVSSGPYAVVRHPMYAYALLLIVGAPLLLGSLWGLLGLVAIVPLLAARALGEEAMLREGLPGYADYAARVRYRLMPGIW